MRDWFASLRANVGIQVAPSLEGVNTASYQGNTAGDAGSVPPKATDFCALPVNENTRTPNVPDPSWWLYEYEERAAIHQYDGGLPRKEAERLAYEATLLAWHRVNGRAPSNTCATCGEALDGWIITLPDGALVHGRCVSDYGQQWRQRAAEALRLAGVHPNATKSHAWSVGYCDGLRGYAVDEWLADNDATQENYRDGWETGNAERLHKRGVPGVPCS